MSELLLPLLLLIVRGRCLLYNSPLDLYLAHLDSFSLGTLVGLSFCWVLNYSLVLSDLDVVSLHHWNIPVDSLS